MALLGQALRAQFGVARAAIEIDTLHCAPPNRRVNSTLYAKSANSKFIPVTAEINMNDIIREEIREHENRLKNAMMTSDIKTLDELLATNLIFTTHFGHVITKNDDISGHKSGFVKINQIELSEEKILIFGDSAIVSVLAHISGAFGGNPSAGNFRFTRVWQKAPNASDWQVIAGHSCLVA